MRVLLLSVGDEILRYPDGAVAERLRSYARCAGEIVQVTFSPVSHQCQVTRWVDPESSAMPTVLSSEFGSRSVETPLSRWERVGVRASSRSVTPRGRPHPRLLSKGEGAVGQLTSIPTRSWSRLTYLADAVRIGHAILSREAFDLIETQDPVLPGLAGLLLGRMHRLPVVVGCHHEYTTSAAWAAERFRNRIESAIARATIARADGVRAVSRRVADGAREIGVAAERVGVAPVPIDANMYERGRKHTPARRGWPAREGSGGASQSVESPGAGPIRTRAFGRRVLFAGRVEPQKDVPGLIRAIATIPGACLDIVGVGSELGTCRDLTGRLGISARIMFHGALAPEALSEFYWACDVFATPSLYEGYGRVFVEAAIHGAPSVGTRVGGIIDIVDESSGVLVAPGDPGALSFALRSLLDNPGRAGELGQSAWRSAVARFDPANDVERIVGFWRQIAGLPRLATETQ